MPLAAGPESRDGFPAAGDRCADFAGSHRSLGQAEEPSHTATTPHEGFN